jgi:hypothetical protein
MSKVELVKRPKVSLKKDLRIWDLKIYRTDHHWEGRFEDEYHDVKSVDKARVELSARILEGLGAANLPEDTNPITAVEVVLVRNQFGQRIGDEVEYRAFNGHIMLRTIEAFDLGTKEGRTIGSTWNAQHSDTCHCWGSEDGDTQLPDW